MVSVISILISTAWAANCHDRYVDWQNPKSICAEWALAGDVLSSFKLDGVEFVVPNPLKVSKLGEGSAEWTKHDFNQLVRTMTDQVAGDTSNGSLNASRRYLASRLSTVTVQILPSTESLCGPGSQTNARYSERTNVVQVCPLVTRLPSSARLPVLAHELGHLADPCNFRQGFAYTDRVPRASDAIVRVVRECAGARGADAIATTMADGDHRADRAVALTPSSGAPFRKAISKLVSCGLLRPLGQPEVPATYEGHPYFAELKSAAVSAGVKLKPTSKVSGVSGLCESSKADKENAADQIGFRLLAADLREHPLQTHGEWITYFYSSINCTPSEHLPGTEGYASSSSRLEALLRIPEVRSLAKCE